MSTHLPGLQLFFGFLHPFVLANLATRSVRVKGNWVLLNIRNAKTVSRSFPIPLMVKE